MHVLPPILVCMHCPLSWYVCTAPYPSMHALSPINGMYALLPILVCMHCPLSWCACTAPYPGMPALPPILVCMHYPGMSVLPHILVCMHCSLSWYACTAPYPGLQGIACQLQHLHCLFACPCFNWVSASVVWW